MQRDISRTLKHAPDIHVSTILLTFESAAEEERLLQALRLVDQAHGPTERIAAMTRDELSELICDGPTDSIEDLTHWDMARREWIRREREYVELFKNVRGWGLMPVRRMQKSRDLDWVDRARSGEEATG